MPRKTEANFRHFHVIPFLKSLKTTSFFPIQQLAIVGDPDFILCCRGTFVALELKKDGEKPRPIQKAKLDWVEKTYGIALAACPENWERIKTELTRLDEGDTEW